MVCKRCIMAVETVMIKLGLTLNSIELGVVEIQESNIDSVRAILIKDLNALGFELLDDKTSKVIDKIKTCIIDLVHRQNNQLKEKLSDYISQNLHQEYSSISNLFSSVEGITIEKYYILQKIERVKELLVYDELTIGEIADLLQYSSTA